MANDDWRLTNQLSYMKGLALSWREYVAPSETWDHDHCEFCFQKFMPAPGGEDIETAGYTTEDEYRWVCGQCFEDFRDLFEWRVAP